MLKRKFKVVAALMSCAVMVSAFAGCSSGNSGQTAKDGVQTIRVWSNNSHSKAVYEELVNEFNQTTGKEKGIKIEYTVKEGEALSQGLELALQNNEAPELFTTGLALKKLAENGYITPLNSLSGGEEFVAKYEGMLKEETHYIGEDIYTVPVTATTQGLVYNKDMFKAAGIVDENGEPTPPKTLDELREYAKKLTNKDKNEYGIIFPMKYAGWYLDDVQAMIMPAVGHMGYDPTTGEFDYSGLIPIWQNILDLYSDGSVYPGGESLDNDPARAQFSYGNIGMKFAYSWDVGVFNDQFPATCDWGVASLPVPDAENHYKQRMFTNRSFFVNAKATEKVSEEAIMTVYNFFNGKELLKKTYEAGLDMPVFAEYIEDASTENLPNGWKEFAELAAISAMNPLQPSVDMEGKLAITDRFMEYVLTGKKTPEEVVEEYTADTIEGQKKYSELHPDIDNAERFIDKNWDIKL